MSHSAPILQSHSRRRRLGHSGVGEPACSAFWSPCYWPPPSAFACQPAAAEFSAVTADTNAMAGQSAVEQPEPAFSEGAARLAPDGPGSREHAPTTTRLELEEQPGSHWHWLTNSENKVRGSIQPFQPSPVRSGQLHQPAAICPCDWRFRSRNGPIRR